jgi:phospholipase/carboxylesterase
VNRLFALLDTLGVIARQMDPRRLPELVALLEGTDLPPAADGTVAAYAMRACAGLREASSAPNPVLAAYRAMRQYSRALEVLTALAEIEPAVGSYLLEPRYRDDPAVLARLASPRADSGVFHAANDTSQRGGFSVYVPPWITEPAPVVMALHGGSGHGRLFLWSWIPEARGRGLIVVAPTALGTTWSLGEPETDAANLRAILAGVSERWPVDPKRLLLTGMSDGGTFTLLSGLSADSPFTHLAPVAASFHPMILGMASPSRLAALPVHLTHGALDWMFPVEMGRTAHRMLQAAGAAVTYREIADLSHAYPRDGQAEVLDWWNRVP